MSDLTIRDTCADDVPALTELLNEIIRAGGTTALETPLTETELSEWFVTGEPVVSSVHRRTRRGSAGVPDGLDVRSASPWLGQHRNLCPHRGDRCRHRQRAVPPDLRQMPAPPV